MISVSGGSASLINTTIADNTDEVYGGGIASFGTLYLAFSTLTGNTVTGAYAYGSPVPTGGGIAALGGTLDVKGSIVAGNEATGGYGQNEIGG